MVNTLIEPVKLRISDFADFGCKSEYVKAIVSALSWANSVNMLDEAEVNEPIFLFLDMMMDGEFCEEEEVFVMPIRYENPGEFVKLVANSLLTFLPLFQIKGANRKDFSQYLFEVSTLSAILRALVLF